MGLTQEQLAVTLDVEPMTISRFERGATLPSIPTLYKLADIFDISMAQMLEAEPQEKFNDAEKIAALLTHLSKDEKKFIQETIERFCALSAKKR